MSRPNCVSCSAPRDGSVAGGTTCTRCNRAPVSRANAVATFAAVSETAEKSVGIRMSFIIMVGERARRVPRLLER
jgi:hypothetical protein